MIQGNARNEKVIREFTDLTTWQAGHTLVLAIYKATKSFPKEEIYSLTDQMRRSAVSITSNIAEGFGRQGYKEKIHFYYLAHGSLTELKNQLLIARDVGYLSSVSFDAIGVLANATHALLQGLIKGIKPFDVFARSEIQKSELLYFSHSTRQ